MDTLTLAIIGHLVGDYLLQNDWMALHKKKNSFRCAVHCLLWTAAVLLFSGWGEMKLRYGFMAGFTLFLTHYIQDRTGIVLWWMKKIGQEQFATGPCSPWSIIVVDNVWHIVTIWAVWRFLA